MTYRLLKIAVSRFEFVFIIEVARGPWGPEGGGVEIARKKLLQPTRALVPFLTGKVLHL